LDLVYYAMEFFTSPFMMLLYISGYGGARQSEVPICSG